MHGMTIAHLGLGILAAGITGSTAWKSEHIQVMHVGDKVTVFGAHGHFYQEWKNYFPEFLLS
jgi:cytochrome c biogenesis factor